MKYTEREVLQFVEENDVKFVKLMFCDIFGELKAISIVSGELSSVFRKGLTFDASKVAGFMNIVATDLLLFPDPDTLALLPWRPQQGRVVRLFCTIKYPDGTPFEGDGRFFLQNAMDYARGKGYNFRFGTSCEFYVFNKDTDGIPTKIPQDKAGYCDAAPADKGENLRRDICLTLEQMDIAPVSSRHEEGPGQNEIDFRPSSALKAADNLVTFKNVVKSVADRNGFYATFMPKPLSDCPGSGLHITMFCMKGTENIFEPRLDELGAEARNMIAGILNRISGMSLFLDSTASSYERLGHLCAPKYISWSHENYAQLIRVPLTRSKENGIILRSPDNTCNPYCALGLIIYACVEGAVKGEKLCEPINFSTNSIPDDVRQNLRTLPLTLGESAEAARNSEFIGSILSENLVSHIISMKTAEDKEYQQSEDKERFVNDRYFLRF
jgi:glutamine synthetase